MAGPRPPEEALESFVRARADDLHRTAAMLTGHEEEADDLFLRTLADRGVRRAVDRGGGEQAALRLLVRAYLRTGARHRDHRVAARELDEGSRDAWATLARLEPRRRAATVLVLVHGWDPVAAARTVGVPRGRVDTLVPTTPGLREMLESVGEHHGRSGSSAP